jgi:hypothetical protein
MNAIAIQYDVSDIERMARAIAVSKLFGVENPEQAIALCLIAQAEGRHPASAAQDYHIIQGRPSKKADAMLRDFISAGGKVEWHVLDDAKADATFSHPSGGSVRISWDMARAQKAQLKTAMWAKYPRQMLRARVVSEGVRTVFPMATSGMYVPEEVQELDAPREQAALPPAGQAPTIEGSAREPEAKPLTRADGREVYAKLSEGNRALTTVEAFNAYWSRDDVRAEANALPVSWKKNLAEEKAEKLKDLQNVPDEAPFPGDL